MIYIYCFALVLVIAIMKFFWGLLHPKGPAALQAKHKKEYLEC
jgi:hypothetical protein